MTNETARREIDSLDYYLQNHTNDYGEESHMAMMMAIKSLDKIEKIQAIIDIDNSVIQEDVMKYKMICEVIANDNR